MNRCRVWAAALSTAALVSACASTPEVAVRAVGTPATVVGGDRLALARSSLALGNVGMALQQFRQGLREQPASIDALAGIAQCYEAMGRTDLSRRYYQEALALAPADTRLLRMYADALSRHGDMAEAQAVISEIAIRTRAPTVQWVIEKTGPVAAAEVARSEEPAPIAGVAPVKPTAVPIATHAATANVRLERVSLGEIALVTSAAPLWRSVRSAPATWLRVERTARIEAAPGPVRMVRLLNAARRQGLAGRSAAQLHQAGWRRLAIGNAPRVRSASLIVYPAGRSGEARALGTRLRISAMRVAPRTDILVLLGRDSA